MGKVLDATPVSFATKALGMGSMSDIILGKKDPGTAAQNLDFRSDAEKAAQSQALGQYSMFLNQDAGAQADAQIQSQQKQIRQNADDMTRVAQQEVAKRGLGGTSLGLGAILGQKANMGERLGDIQASRPMLENQIKRGNLEFASNGINSLLNSRMNAFAYQPAQASKGRQGGLAPLIGAAAGAYLGGPAGAQAGMGIGQMATQIG